MLCFPLPPSLVEFLFHFCVRSEAEHWPPHQKTRVLLGHFPWDLVYESQPLSWFVKFPWCWPRGGCHSHCDLDDSGGEAVAAADLTNVLCHPWCPLQKNYRCSLQSIPFFFQAAVLAVGKTQLGKGQDALPWIRSSTWIVLPASSVTTSSEGSPSTRWRRKPTASPATL